MFAGGVIVMTKKPVKGRPKASDPKTPIASIKGGSAYKQWLKDLADFSRLPITILVEHALFEYAQTHEFPKEPPKR